MRATFLTTFLTFCFVPHVAAGEEVKPNTLTPKEVADGWILLFDGATTFGWQPKTETGNAQVKDQALDLRDLKPSEGIRTTTFFHEFELFFEYHLKAGDAALVITSPALKEATLAELK